ncbi:ABC transporter ATP-binding protein [Leptolyngbya sp. AN02str]|uniref:ABC transporter ATP-binding protein n=1 Tax=Leptolyngbya sp. AN02str TaxID=3423363 RepID=UPI003D31FD63
MIEVEHLSKTYGTTPAIKDVTFSVEPGEILGFLGPNGAGKTTTMRILTGYLPATEGTARIAGFDVHEQSMEVRKRIGYLPETPPLYTDMTVEGFLHFVARLKGVAPGDRATQVNSAMERCNLQEKRNVLIRKLSKGFRQRVGIAQAIVHDPPVIILDEPTVGLDPRQIIDVRNLIKSLAGDHTIILSTHILPEVSMTCNRVAIINRGAVVATNTPDQLMEQLIGGAGYELEVRGDVTQLEPLLQHISGVKSVEPLVATAERAESHTRLRVMSDTGAEPGQAIAECVVNAGLGLYEMRRIKISLEDVFLELTTEEKPVEAEASQALNPSHPETEATLSELSEPPNETTDSEGEAA